MEEQFFKQTDFHIAALYGDMPTLVKEIEKGVNILALNGYKRSALHNAAIGGQLSVAQLLLIDPFVSDLVNLPDVDGNTCVHLAALHGRSAILALLIDNGADFTVANNNGLFPVHLAAKRGHWNALKLIHDSEIRIDTKCEANGRTVIHYAAESGSEEVVQNLITYNAVDLADTDSNGNLASHCAAMGNQLVTLKLLAKQGIYADRVANKMGRYPLHYAAASNAVACVHWILENSLPNHLNATDNEGNTASHTAGLYGSAQSFNCLVSHGCDLSIKNRAGEVPIEAARRGGHPIVITKALENKIECPQCHTVRDEKVWRVSHPIPSVMQKIADDQLRLFRQRGKKDALFKPLGPEDKVQNEQMTMYSSSNKSTQRSSSSRRPLSSASSSSSGRDLLRHPPPIAAPKALPTGRSKEIMAVGNDLAAKFYGEHINQRFYKLK